MHGCSMVKVSPEMVAILGGGAPGGAALPDDAAALVVNLVSPASVRIFVEARALDWSEHCSERTLALIVTRAALSRTFDWSPADSDGCEFYLDPDAAGIADQILGARYDAEAQ